MNKISEFAFTQGDKAPTAQTDEVDFAAFLQMAWLGRWKIILSILAGLLIAFLYANNLRPLYTSYVEVLLEETQDPVDLGAVLTANAGTDKEILTEIEVIQSRTILQQVIERLDLISDVEFNPSIVPPEPNFLEKAGFWPIEIKSFWPPEVEFGAVDEEAPPSAEETMREAVDVLGRKVSAAQIRGTVIIRVVVEAWSPRKAAAIANTIAAVYIEQRVQVKIDAQDFASKFIGEKVVELREEVERLESAVQNFRSESAVGDENNQEVVRFEEMQNRAAAARSVENDLRARLDQFDKAVRAGDTTIAAARFLDDRRINNLIRGGFLSDARDQIDATVERLTADYNLAKRRREALDASLLELEAALKEDASKLVELRQLEREAEASKLLFTTFLSRQKETAAQQGLLTPNARVMTGAEPPKTPSAPRKKVIMAIGSFAGFLAGIGLIFLLEQTKSRFSTVEELEAWSGLSVLGTIPKYVRSSKRGDVLQYVINNPRSGISEAARNLRTSVLLANIDNPPQVITVTSSVPEEGKSISAILLGAVTAQMGKSALVVDMDLRRRTLHETLGVKSDLGLISVLNGTVPLHQAIQHHPETGLDFLVVEHNAVSAPDILSSKAFKDMIATARETYDIIVLDSPPVLAVTDARIIAKSSDALIYVVRWDNTPRAVVKQGLSTLASTGLEISGFVLSRVDRNKQKKYAAGYYGYYGPQGNKIQNKIDNYYSE